MQRESARDVFAFWADARRGRFDRVAYHEGTFAVRCIEAPIAVYRHNRGRGDSAYVFIQHGSYQCVPIDEQPEIEAGYVHLHRGIGDAKVFRFGSAFRTKSAPRLTCAWETYSQLQFDILSRSDVSFNSIHDRTKRAETGHILDDSWMTDELAKERGLDIDHDSWTRSGKQLTRASH